MGYWRMKFGRMDERVDKMSWSMSAGNLSSIYRSGGEGRGKFVWTSGNLNYQRVMLALHAHIAEY